MSLPRVYLETSFFGHLAPRGTIRTRVFPCGHRVPAQHVISATVVRAPEERLNIDGILRRMPRSRKPNVMCVRDSYEVAARS